MSTWSDVLAAQREREEILEAQLPKSRIISKSIFRDPLSGLLKTMPKFNRGSKARFFITRLEAARFIRRVRRYRRAYGKQVIGI